MQRALSASVLEAVKTLGGFLIVPLFIACVSLWNGLPSSTDGPVKCGDRIMRVDDECVIGTQVGASVGVGAHYTYDEMIAKRARESRSNPGMLAVGGGLIAFDLAVVAGYTAYLRRIGM
ncbi:hypothetical protein [Streptomyces sp. NPDC088400]|uniref:hypothetical protein n=1 Tax=Streptomyces sp. NPDC088400 TaxID=3365861 RepID=UPI00380A213E